MASRKPTTTSVTTKKRKSLTTQEGTQSEQTDTEKSEDKVLTKLVSTGITPDQRSQMIAEAAYYRAEKRDFDSQGQEQDWIDAEAEIDAKLNQLSQEKSAKAPH